MYNVLTNDLGCVYRSAESKSDLILALSHHAFALPA